MWYDAPSDTLVYDVPDPLRIAAACPDARRLHNGFIYLPAHLENLQQLARLGLPTIAPMDIDYDWPIMRGRSPLIHQRIMANFMALNPRSFNLSDMGTMKTLAALWAADYIMEQYSKGACRCLIVAPLSTLHRVWANEIFQNFIGRRTCVVLHGDAKKRQKLLAMPHDFYIINHDGVGVGAQVNRKVAFGGFSADLAARSDIRIALVDEFSAYSDAGTRRHRIARNLLGTRPYLWLMSGTPTPNGPTDAYGPSKLVNNAFGETFTGFKQRVMMQVTQFKWAPKRGAHEEAKKLLSPSVRFAIDDCIDLPPCTVQGRDAEMSDEQKKAYLELKRDLRLKMKDGKPITAVNEGVLRWKLLQIAAGAIYDGDRFVHYIDSKPRQAVLREVMSECNEKIIVFAPLTSIVNLLYSTLEKEFTCARIDGQVSFKERTSIFSDFQQSDKPRVLIAHPQTMSHGLTLTAASMIVWYAPIDRTEVYLQANKRIDRPGQTKHTNIVQIASSPIEREIYRRLEANETMQGCVLKLAESQT